jgi:tRNA nucleotidyltransferase (CCA-adding enzyme)
MEIITTHLNADFDGLASMLAARKLYPGAKLVFSGSQERNLRRYLATSPHAFAFTKQKEIDLAAVTRLIMVDTRQAARLGNLAGCLENPGLSLHIYDHHPALPGDLQGEFEEIRPVGSTATVFTQIFRERGLPVDRAEATLLAMAIYEDTGSFTFGTTTPDDLEAMAWLLSLGADLPTVAQYISQELTSAQVTLLHQLMKAATTYNIQGIDIVIAKIRLPEYVDEFALIVRRFMTMENLNCLFALANMGERTYLIARSRVPEVNVGAISIDFGGGGHASAAAATLRDLTLVEAEEKLLHLLHKHVRPVAIAARIMSAPVISVSPEVSLKEANQIIDRYNVTVLPVLQDNRVLGLISRRVAGKAIYHGLGDQPVSEYMTTEFASLAPDATLADIQELIIEHRQRFIPIVEGDLVIGVITRTDLLNLLIGDPAHLPRETLESQEQMAPERQRNLNNLMVENLSREVIVLLRTIGEVAATAGYKAYAVGGFVRDLLLRQPNLDLDIVIEGDGIMFARQLSRQLGGEVRTHEKFSTAMVILPGGFKIDIATARLEYYEYPAAMPTVELSSLKLDLYRRDFTINAMAIHLDPDSFGLLVDFFNCQNDLKDRRIRILHNLSFVEDPTRIFRALRFEQRMGFQLAKHTERMIKNAVRMNLFDRLPGKKNTRLGSRIFSELQLLLAEENPLPAIRRLAQFDLLKFLHPALQLDPPLIESIESTREALTWYRLLYQKESCQQWLVFLLALTSRLTARQMPVFRRRLDIPERQAQQLLREKSHLTRLLKLLKQARELKPSEIHKLLHPLSLEGLLCLMGLVRRPEGKKAISHYIAYLRHLKTHLKGSDLKSLGYAAGPIYRRILERLLQARLDNEVESREEEIDFVKSRYPAERYQQGDRHRRPQKT